MVALTQQEKQVVDLFRRLEPGRRRYVLLEMAQTDPEAWKRYQSQGELRLRALARQMGLDWDQMDDLEKQDFVEHELDGGNA